MSLLKKNKLRDDSGLIKKYCILSGAWAVFIMIFVFMAHDNSLLGGDATVLRMDLYHQYGPLYAELYDRITNGYSLVYSWTSGLGGGFLGNLFNYCASPFAIIILLFGHKNMPEAIGVMILLKAVLSSATFSYYLNKSAKKPTILSIPFGLLYAFSGYFIAYSWNIMWLDAMSIFPLVILGIEKIIDKKKPSLFIFALTYTMITNYYMAYMVCIIAVIYFLIYYFANYEFSAKLNPNTEKETVYAKGLVVKEESVEHTPLLTKEATASGIPESVADAIKGEIDADAVLEQIEPEVPEEAPVLKIEKGFNFRNSRFLAAGFTFAFASILSFMLSAFALLPVFFALQSSSATSSTFPSDLRTYFNLFDFIANHLPSVETTIRSSGNNVIPNVYCGLITVLLLPFYFLSDKIRGRKKVCAFLFLLLFYFSFNTNYLNFIWHGMHFPNDLPYRFSFAYSFLLLCLAYQALLHIRDFSKKYYILAGFGVCALIAVVSKIGVKNVSNYSMVLAFILTAVYVIVGGLFLSPRYGEKMIAKLLIFVIIVEICFANTPRYVMSQSKTDYTVDYEPYQQIRSLTEKEETELFYRTELSKLRARMDPSWFGYRGVSTFSSMAYEKTSALMKSLGLFSNNINSYTYYPQTPLFNSIFSIKYVYDNTDLVSENDYYTLISSNEKYDAYQYNYFLPIAFSVNGNVENWNASGSNPFEVQNSLLQDMTGVENILENVNATFVTSTNINDLNLFSVNSSSVFYIAKTDASKSATVKIEIDIEEDGQYYVYAGSVGLSNINISAGSSYSYRYSSTGIQPFTLDTGVLSAGDKITVEYTVLESNASANLNFCCAKLNSEKFRRAYDKILENGIIELTAFDETAFSGNINVKNPDAVIFTSIPYDESWNIYVDGQLLKYDHQNVSPKKLFGLSISQTDQTAGEIFAIGKGLIGFHVSQGEHSIRFEYKAKGLNAGIELSVFALALVILLLIFKFTLKKRYLKKGKTLEVFETPIEIIESKEDANADTL